MNIQGIWNIINGQLCLYYGFFLECADADLRRAYWESVGCAFLEETEHILYKLKKQDLWHFDSDVIKKFLVDTLKKCGIRSEVAQIGGIRIDYANITISVSHYCGFLAISISKTHLPLHEYPPEQRFLFPEADLDLRA